MHGTAAVDIDALARQITAEWRNATASILRTGKLLIRAKRVVGHGKWMDLVAKLPFSDRAAQMLMEIARHPVLSNPKHASNLPPSWATLHRLTALPDRELKELLSNGTINCETQRKDVDELIKRTRDDGLYSFGRIPEALRTLLGFMIKYPDPAELTDVYINYMLHPGHSVCSSELAELLPWLTKFQRICEREQAEFDNYEKAEGDRFEAMHANQNRSTPNDNDDADDD